MQNPQFTRILILTFFSLSFLLGTAQETKPDTVQAGIYITSIHDIDFKEKEYTTNLWLWLKYKNKDFDFYNNLEIPQAKDNKITTYGVICKISFRLDEKR